MNTPATQPAARAGKPLRTRAAAAAAVGFIAIAGFEIALALGAPLGRAAWGGAHVYLTEGLRIASVFSAVFWVLAALRRVCPRGIPPIPGAVPREPVGRMGADGRASARRADELRLAERLGAFPAGPHRPGHGGAVPDRRARRPPSSSHPGPARGLNGNGPLPQSDQPKEQGTAAGTAFPAMRAQADGGSWPRQRVRRPAHRPTWLAGHSMCLPVRYLR